MNVLERAEKSLECLKNYDGTSKNYEVQAAASTLGRCLGALGTKPNSARHFANLLAPALPILVTLASHDSAEVRLVGDEALNRVLVGGLAFNSHKVNAMLLNLLDPVKSVRWNRAILGRLCVGESWVRAGAGRLRAQAQSLFSKLSQAVRAARGEELALLAEALEAHLPRLLRALADYGTEEELLALYAALAAQAPRAPHASARSALAAALAHLAALRPRLLAALLADAAEKLRLKNSEEKCEMSSEAEAEVVAWLGVLRAALLAAPHLDHHQQWLEVCLQWAERAGSSGLQSGALECLWAVLSARGEAGEVGERAAVRGARVLAARYVLAGRAVRVSVRAAALACVPELLLAAPRLLACDLRAPHPAPPLHHSGLSEGVDSVREDEEEFVLERNVCYQESFTEWLEHEPPRSPPASADPSADLPADPPADAADPPASPAPSDPPDLGVEADLARSRLTSSATDPSTPYPMSSSGDPHSVDLELDIKFDHFAESPPCPGFEQAERCGTDAPKAEVPAEGEESSGEETDGQHMSDILGLGAHPDPQVRGLVGACAAACLRGALREARGELARWRPAERLPPAVARRLQPAELLRAATAPLRDDVHTAVSVALGALAPLAAALARSEERALLERLLAELVGAERSAYWVCRLNVVRVYAGVGGGAWRAGEAARAAAALHRLLPDADPRVRTAAATALAEILPISKGPAEDACAEEWADACGCGPECPERGAPPAHLLRELWALRELPPELRAAAPAAAPAALPAALADLALALHASHCPQYTHGILETLLATCRRWPPAQHRDAYAGLGLLRHALALLAARPPPALPARLALLRLCRLLYPAELDAVLGHREEGARWRHVRDARAAELAEHFLRITFKTLNVLAHVVEEAAPARALPASPGRRRLQESASRKSTSERIEENGVSGGAAGGAVGAGAGAAAGAGGAARGYGHFADEPLYLALHDQLAAAYCNHKVNVDTSNSIFYEWMVSALEALGVQLELSSERELGALSDELLRYLRALLPHCAPHVLPAVTRLLRCLFGTNLLAQHAEYARLAEPAPRAPHRRPLDTDRLQDEAAAAERWARHRRLLLALDACLRARADRRWGTDKKDLERYIRLFEPLVIEALKMYTVQQEPRAQCAVLQLLGQLVALRVNYCMLDSEQLFIGFLMKQLELVEQHEIPNCCELVESILQFLVQLATSTHHTKQIIEIPKVCDGLVAGGALQQVAGGLRALALRLFGAAGGPGRALQQEAQAAREVVFHMLLKSMQREAVLRAVGAAVALAAERGEGERWARAARGTLLRLLAERSLRLERAPAVQALLALLDTLHAVLPPDQPALDDALKILLQAPPDQASELDAKVRHLAGALALLRCVVGAAAEPDVLLAVERLRAHVAPRAVFLRARPDHDPLRANEPCAGLAPDLILARLLLVLLTTAFAELERRPRHRLLHALALHLVLHAKRTLHLADGCAFPLTAKSAQTLLSEEQSGLNTGLYSPDENIPLEALNRVALRALGERPLLTVHWSHLLVRLRLLGHAYWRRLVGFARDVPLAPAARCAAGPVPAAVALAFCEHFAEQGLAEAVPLSWLLSSRAHVLLARCREPPVAQLLAAVHDAPAASALLLHAIAARCQPCIKGEFGLKALDVMSQSHPSQSGALVLLACRLLPALEPALAARFEREAAARCRDLREAGADAARDQLAKEDVQGALEALHAMRAPRRPSALLAELSALAAAAFDLSPLEASAVRAVNPRAVLTTTLDDRWLLQRAKTACSRRDGEPTAFRAHRDYALLLSHLPLEDVKAVMACPEFDRNIIIACFKVACDNFLKEFYKRVSERDAREVQLERSRPRREDASKKRAATLDSNKLEAGDIHVFKKTDRLESKSQFFIPMTPISDGEVEENIETSQIEEEEIKLSIPELPDLLVASTGKLEECVAEVGRLAARGSRPPSHHGHHGERGPRRPPALFHDRLFRAEFESLHALLAAYLDARKRLLAALRAEHCEEAAERLLGGGLARALAAFSVVSLQYLAFLAEAREAAALVRAAGPLRAVGRALQLPAVRAELAEPRSEPRVHAALAAFYTLVQYLLQDKIPLVAKSYIRYKDEGPRAAAADSADRLLALLEYWERHCGAGAAHSRAGLGARLQRALGRVLAALAGLEAVRGAALLPPLACAEAELAGSGRVELPLAALQDMDALQSFLYRVQAVGWDTRKHFEELWVALLGALQGNGPHWAARGLARLLASAAPPPAHVPRALPPLSDGMQRLRTALVGTGAFELFEPQDLERLPLAAEQRRPPPHFSAQYLRLAARLARSGPPRLRRELSRAPRARVDLPSCVRLLMDVAADMLDPKAETGAATRVALVGAITTASCVFREREVWQRAAALLGALPATAGPHPAAVALHALAQCVAVLGADEPAAELALVHDKLFKSMSSGYAPLRQAALRGWLLQVSRAPLAADAAARLRRALAERLARPDALSVREQALHWVLFFELEPGGGALAADALLARPHHYCADLLARGISTALQRSELPKELEKSIAEKMWKAGERHRAEVTLVAAFGAEEGGRAARRSDVAEMEPDALLSAMERLTALYAALRGCEAARAQAALAGGLRCLLRDALPPPATLSRALLELLDALAAPPAAPRARAAMLHCDIVYEVLEAGAECAQLDVLRGWLLEALPQLLADKLPARLLPAALLALLVAAAEPAPLRRARWLARAALGRAVGGAGELSFEERRLLCLAGARAAGGRRSAALRRLAAASPLLADLRRCLDDACDPAGSPPPT